MAYSRQKTWVDNTAQQVDAVWLNTVEQALVDLYGVVPATNGALVWDGTKFTAAAKIKDAQVDAAAAIVGSKLATGLTGPPGAEVDYAEFAASVTTTATSAATATAVVTGSAVTYDGTTAIIVEFYCSNAATVATAGAAIVAELYDGVTDLGIMAQFATAAALSVGSSLLGRRKITPSAGAHTFSVKGWTTVAGTATFSSGAARLPGYMRIVRA